MKYKFTITGIDCPNCAAKLADIMAKIDGVNSSKINFLTERLTVESDMGDDVLMPLLTNAAKSFDKGIKIEK